MSRSFVSMSRSLESKLGLLCRLSAQKCANTAQKCANTAQKCANTPAEARQSVQLAALGVAFGDSPVPFMPPNLDF